MRTIRRSATSRSRCSYENMWIGNVAMIKELRAAAHPNRDPRERENREAVDHSKAALRLVVVDTRSLPCSHLAALFSTLFWMYCTVWRWRAVILSPFSSAYYSK